MRSQPGPGPLLQAALDPLVAIATLAGAVSFSPALLVAPQQQRAW